MFHVIYPRGNTNIIHLQVITVKIFTKKMVDIWSDGNQNLAKNVAQLPPKMASNLVC